MEEAAGSYIKMKRLKKAKANRRKLEEAGNYRRLRKLMETKIRQRKLKKAKRN